MSIAKHSFFSRVRRSIFTDPVYPQAGRERKRSIFDNLILHIHPRTLPEDTLKFTLTWGLGGMPLVLAILLALTGILLLFVYEPSPDKAYESILVLQNHVPFGQLIRNIHHWSGNILVILSFLHLLRVYFTGAFHNARQFNWVIGVFLMLLVLFSNFTGYLLPWDQLAFWAVTIAANIAASINEFTDVIGITEYFDFGTLIKLLFFGIPAAKCNSNDKADENRKNETGNNSWFSLFILTGESPDKACTHA